MVREILVDWTTPAGGGQVSVFHFIEATAVAAQRAALNTFLQSVDNNCSTSTTWSIRSAGRDVDTATGALTASWGDSTAYTAPGGITGSPVADATQALLRWNTGRVVAGRFLRGRTYIPGISSGSLNSGNLLAATQTALATAGQALVTAGVQLAVWHRPKAGVGGEAWAVQTASCWQEFAVLRRRRG